MSAFKPVHPNYKQQQQEEENDVASQPGQVQNFLPTTSTKNSATFDPTPTWRDTVQRNTDQANPAPVNVPRLVGQRSARVDEGSNDGFPTPALSKGKVTGVISTGHWFDAKMMGPDPAKQWMKAYGPCKNNGCRVQAEDITIIRNCIGNQSVQFNPDGSKTVTFTEK